MLNKILLTMCVIFVLTNTALSLFLLTRSFKAQTQRESTQKLVEDLRCMLLILPQDRTEENLRACGVSKN